MVKLVPLEFMNSFVDSICELPECCNLQSTLSDILSALLGYNKSTEVKYRHELKTVVIDKAIINLKGSRNVIGSLTVLFVMMKFENLYE